MERREEMPKEIRKLVHLPCEPRLYLSARVLPYQTQIVLADRTESVW